KQIRGHAELGELEVETGSDQQAQQEGAEQGNPRRTGSQRIPRLQRDIAKPWSCNHNARSPSGVPQRFCAPRPPTPREARDSIAPQFPHARWRPASYSTANSDCVEVAQ